MKMVFPRRSPEVVGELFRHPDRKFWVSPCSDAVRGGLDRSGAIRLPIKAAASGAQRASSCENDAPAHHSAGPFFLRRAARGRCRYSRYSCLHGVSRPSSCCQANVGRFWRRSQRSSGQRASCHVHRTLLHRRNVIMCSVRGRWPPQAGRVKIIDFSKTTQLSCSQRADHGTLRGSASFALVHEKVWSKVNWLLVQGPQRAGV